jgi:ABC-type multidrug transport system fused ATPase/permease subunit
MDEAEIKLIISAISVLVPLAGTVIPLLDARSKISSDVDLMLKAQGLPFGSQMRTEIERHLNDDVRARFSARDSRAEMMSRISASSDSKKAVMASVLLFLFALAALAFYILISIAYQIISTCANHFFGFIVFVILLAIAFAAVALYVFLLDRIVTFFGNRFSKGNPDSEGRKDDEHQAG